MNKCLVTSLAVGALIVIAGCGPRTMAGGQSVGGASTTTSTSETSPSPDAQPDHPIVDSSSAQSLCMRFAGTGRLLAAYASSIGDVVGWQESIDAGVSRWRDHGLSSFAAVCYYEGSFPVPCHPPLPGQPDCQPATRICVIASPDGQGFAYWTGDDSLSLRRPPHLPGPPPAPRTPPPTSPPNS